jgi:hypothetical protein
MTRTANRWAAWLAWVALMSIVWAIFVPRGLSVGTFTLLALTGPLVLLAGLAAWGARRASPLRGNAGAPIAAAEAASSVRR